ncbi:MAG: AbrB/MazE/SpoVT family DNA-binding domain-containing protein [Methanobrevibacter sp. CfCl-M3]
MITTKVYDNLQTAIPSEIRKKFNVLPDDIVEWFTEENGEVKVKFRKKSKLFDIVGIVSSETPVDSVKIQKKLDHGDKIDNIRH